MSYDKAMTDLPLKKKLWDIVESYIDERVFTDLSMYKSLENKEVIQDIVDELTDLAWKIEKEMKEEGEK